MASGTANGQQVGHVGVRAAVGRGREEGRGSACTASAARWSRAARVGRSAVREPLPAGLRTVRGQGKTVK